MRLKFITMGSEANRLRRKWQDYSGSNATIAEHSFYEVFKELFKETEYVLNTKPKCFKKLYVDVALSAEEQSEIYTPAKPITRHGLEPDCSITNKRTGKTIFIELKRQDGWVEGKERKDGRGNAHERLCKYFTPGLLRACREEGNISEEYYPFWIVFQGDITRDPCRVREITYWFAENKANFTFWRNKSNPLVLIEHFEQYIVPILE